VWKLARTATITRAKLARAYANVGQPQEAAPLCWQALDDSDRLGSFSARVNCAAPYQYSTAGNGRDDVHAVIQRLTPSA
jgi:hypothetical protein